MKHVDFSHVHIADSFWTPRLLTNASGTLPALIEQWEQSGRVQNFISTAEQRGPHTNGTWDDSEVYKAIEGIAYNLVSTPDAKLEAKADEWIDLIAAAQQEDGYIGTYFTLVKPEGRWNNMDGCEMYCAGHLIEAGVAYYKATGKRKLLDVGQKMADHIISLFGPDKRHWVPGHQEIELALLKLFEVTQERKYLEFAYWLFEERGHGYGKSDVRNGIGWPYPSYQVQDKVPVRDMESIHGHAVRAMYQFCGMSDLSSYMPETGYIDALDRLWDDVTGTRMYITGGIGVAYSSAYAICEGFAAPYELPNYDAYCETCASVGMAFWNHRMGEWKANAKYGDIVEKEMYNGILSGVSLDGRKFFYTNPLASRGDHHRFTWHPCPCCPPNLARFIPSVGNYVYATGKDAVWVNQYISNEAEFQAGKKTVRLELNTEYPWDGLVSMAFRSSYKGNVKLRIPGWCKSFAVCVNGKERKIETEFGYAVLKGGWKKGDTILLNLDMPVELIAADPRVKEDAGLRAVQRGPLVYCIESVDNDVDFDSITIADGSDFETSFEEDLLGGVVAITAKSGTSKLHFIPYYAWDNRAPGQMKVWL